MLGVDTMKTALKISCQMLCATFFGCATVEGDAEINGKLDSIIIPGIHFSSAVIDDVVTFIEEASAAGDPEALELVCEQYKAEYEIRNGVVVIKSNVDHPE